MDLATAESSDFRSSLQTRFELGKPASGTVELVEVQEHPLVDGQTRQGFSLVFRSDAEEIMDQGIYNLTHSELGDIAVFLVPLGPRDGGALYEAVFN